MARSVWIENQPSDAVVAPHAPGRKLRGRFLHITDPNYKPGTKASKSCHRKKGAGGVLGYPGTRCDSPLLLLDATFDWIKNNVVDDIDFIVWTGDAARHDNDDNIPRSVDEVINQNELVVDHVLDFFTHSSHTESQLDGVPSSRPLAIPFIPNIGNNDFMPHNIFKAGPNCWTKTFARLWIRFIPEDQRHSFVEGGWFYVEAIPNKLAVFSLNTMYLFEKNAAAYGCYDPGEPGYEYFEWLRIQLQQMRDRGMKAILLGHVPPAYAGKRMNWDKGCWQKYTLWMRQYRDIIIGSMYGHMNLDHFILQDFDDLKIGGEKLSYGAAGTSILDSNDEEEDELIAKSKGRAKYLDQLRKQWYKLPAVPDSEDSDTSEILKKKKKNKKKKELAEIGGEFAERYSLSLVSPSVIPNYFPSIRVIEYNISGFEDTPVWQDTSVPQDDESIEGHSKCTLKDLEPDVESLKKKKKKKKPKVPQFDMPQAPSKTDLPGPAYSNQPLTWLSYTQYYSNITKIEEEAEDALLVNKKKYGNDHQKYPPNFGYEILYDTKEDGIYKMKDMTVRSYLHLAKKIGKGWKKEKKARESVTSEEGSGDGGSVENAVKKNQVWQTFISRAFTGMFGVDALEEMMN
ncbi:Endopolyphosphatase [Ascosphaera pollenicola]|nr:Endopolyphosphatase [Ascosphaera pollenicola]